MRRIDTALAILICLIGPGLVACDGHAPDEARSRHLRLSGSSTVAPLVLEIAKRYEALHPGIRVEVQSGGSGRGIADAMAGTVDIGMTSRALKDGETDLVATAIARDGIAMIVHAENPLAGLSTPAIVGIYRGVIDNWRDLDGGEAEIVVVNKAEGRATLDLFLTHFGLSNADIEADIVVGENEQAIKTIAGNPSAIGYVSIGAAEYSAQTGVPIKLLAIDGQAASLSALRTGGYPITRPLNLVTKGPPQGMARDFIDFARSPEVYDLVDSLYFVPLAP